MNIPAKFGVDPDNYRQMYEMKSLVYEPIYEPINFEDFYKSTTVKLIQNKIDTNDQYMGLFGSRKVTNFTEVEKFNDYTNPNTDEFLTTMRCLNIFLDDKQGHHERKAFTFVDMIS